MNGDPNDPNDPGLICICGQTGGVWLPGQAEPLDASRVGVLDPGYMPGARRQLVNLLNDEPLDDAAAQQKEES